MVFHHIGCLVADISEAIEEYKKIHGESIVSSPHFNIEPQKVKVCFIELTSGSFIEFVEPYGDNRRLQKMLKRNSSFYHIGYKSDKYDKDSKDLIEKGYHKMSDFHSIAFESKRCSFFLNSLGHLIELIED